jgi:putative monooxygenase
MSAPVVLRAEGRFSFARGAGVHTEPMVTKAHGAVGLMTGITTFSAGAEVGFHRHNCEESVVVLEGNALFESDSITEELVAGDTTLVPAGMAHRFRNNGEAKMRILWIYGSVDATRTKLPSGETVLISDEAAR